MIVVVVVFFIRIYQFTFSVSSLGLLPAFKAWQLNDSIGNVTYQSQKLSGNLSKPDDSLSLKCMILLRKKENV